MSPSPRSRLAWTGAAVLALVVTGWIVFDARQRSAAAQPAPRPVAERGDLLPAELTTIEIFERTRASVVFITTQERVIDVWTRSVFDVPRGSGSGFVWDENGHIVTNYHVLERASGAQVILSDGRSLRASRVGVSPLHDLAVLQIAAPDLPPPLPVGTSADLRVGQTTLAIGNPFGLDWTLTTGIVSALDRSLPSPGGRSLNERLIQTDAAINPGNSGGPLLDSAGRLIGVNSAIFSPSGASAGVGFAVPVDTVNRVVPQLIARGEYVRPVLGIEVDERLNQLVTNRLDVTGVVVVRVTPGTGAADAGLQGIRVTGEGAIVPGDIILAVEGEEVESVGELTSRVDEYPVGAVVRLTVLRDGNTRDLEVTLQAGDR